MKLNTHTKRSNPSSDLGGKKSDPIFYDPNFSIETPDSQYRPEWIVIYGILGFAIWIVALAILW